MAPFFILLFVWLIAFLALRHKRIRNEMQRDVQLALLNKFQSGQEITGFLKTEEGRQLLDRLGGPAEDPRLRALGLLIPACILSSVGIALAIASKIIQEPHLVVGALVVGSVGIGMFIAAAVTYLFSRKIARERKAN
jgi:hypothetical protein